MASTTKAEWTAKAGDVKALSARMDTMAKAYFTNPRLPQDIGGVLGGRGKNIDLNAIRKGLIEPGAYMLEMKSSRLRPVLFYTLMRALGADADRYVELCLIPEIIHNATLARDDIEDHSDSRRGVPALHKKFGDVIANNWADFGYFWPMEDLVKQNNGLPPELKSKLIDIYVTGMTQLVTGQTEDLVWGQGSVPITSITEDNVLCMLYGKNGGMLEMIGRMAAVVAGASQDTVNAVANFCVELGIAHQLHDDLGNLEPKEEGDIASKKGIAGEDIREGKVTYLVVHALHHANETDRERLKVILKAYDPEHPEAYDYSLIQEGIAILERAGSLQHAREKERQVIDDAWAKVEPFLPTSDAKLMLRFLAEYIITKK